MIYLFQNRKGEDIMKLDGKVAIVTGGAMGNGLGIVKVFLKYGADVIIIDNSDKLQQTLL